MLSVIQAAGWPIWPLIACSFLAVILIVERLISLNSSRVIPKKLLEEVLGASRERLPSADVMQHLERSSVYGGVLAAGLRALHSNPRLTEAELLATFEGAGRAAAHKLEKFLPALGTIASVAPLMGLFGTIVGMIEIFASQNAVGGTSPQQLAHGISVALYNTAFGLMIAIPALIFWRYFRARVDGYLLHMELGAQQLARHLGRHLHK